MYAKVHTRTIRRWVKAGMLTAERDGQTIYIKSQLDGFGRNEGKKQSADRQREQEAQADYKTAKARLVELELKIAQGKLIEKGEIEKRDIARVLAVKRALLGLGRKVAPRAARIKEPRKVATLIDKEVREIIEGFVKG